MFQVGALFGGVGLIAFCSTRQKGPTDLACGRVLVQRAALPFLASPARRRRLGGRYRIMASRWAMRLRSAMDLATAWVG